MRGLLLGGASLLLAALVGCGLLLEGDRRNGAPSGATGTAPLGLEAAVTGAVGASHPRFAVQRAGATLVARGGGLATEFRGTGPSVSAAGGSLGMALAGIGRGGALQAVRSGAPSAKRNTVSYDRGEGVTEWYRNGPLGLEQGFTLSHRVGAGSGPLTLALDLSGPLRPERRGSAIVFDAGDSATPVVSYGGLAVVDADGRSIPARLDLASGRIVLAVQDRAARYPLTIDPLIQQGSKFTGSGANGLAWFGSSVAISADGNTALVGGPFDSFAANQAAGAAWVFTRSGPTWTQQGPKLTGTAPNVRGQYGTSVALSADGNTALIGGPYDNGDEGAVWVYTRSGGTWTQQGPKLTASEENGHGLFGFSVAISADGNTALIGARDDNSTVGAGWVFSRSGGTWTQQGGKLTGTGEVGNAFVGWEVALSGDGNTALLGGINDAGGTGAAWAFTRSGGTWTQQGPKLTGGGASSNAGFGYGMALSTDGNQAILSGPNDGDTGAFWYFKRTGTTWTQEGTKVIPSDAAGADFFGRDVALSAAGDVAFVGSSEDSAVGAVRVFRRIGSVWAQEGAKLTADDQVGLGAFGTSVALSADGATGLVGGPIDSGQVGAVWVFADPNPVRDPTIAFQGASPAANANGWNNTNVTLTWNCTAASGTPLPPVTVTLTNEGAGQSGTGTCTDPSTGRSVSDTRGGINIDKTAPEASVSFDPHGGLVVLGRDALSGVPAGAIDPTVTGTNPTRPVRDESRSYRVVDAAGNTLVLVLGVKVRPDALDASFTTLSYKGAAPVAVPDTKLHYDWNFTAAGVLDHAHQVVELGSGATKRLVDASYDGKKGQTQITAEPGHVRTTRTGLVIVRVVTAGGALTIEY